ncbi:hypothetical protein ACHAWO_005880 [Cyclotella atomus]|uniref:Uncharacterized protein n=1 Tax=Cyclotella atomus TaxID=382360 RepID=A0ABD3NQ02_9STRA
MKLSTEKESRNLPQWQTKRHLDSGLDSGWDEGRTSGPAFNNPDGSSPSPTEYNAVVRHYFKTIQEEDDDLIDSNIDVLRFGISRTYRKSSELMAGSAGLPKDQVETMNRWRKIERSKGKMPQFDMADHYADAKQLITLTWRYSIRFIRRMTGHPFGAG